MLDIVPADAVFEGRTVGEWTAKWWQWAFSIPERVNPVEDRDGSFCDQGQDGPVWFLAATFGDIGNTNANRIRRICGMPADRAILIPVSNCCFNRQTDGNRPESELLAGTREDLRRTTFARLNIDGEDVLQYYYVESPLFELDFPDNAILGKTRGRTQGVSVGLWILLRSLPAGPHNINIDAEIPPRFATHVTYDLTVSEIFTSDLNKILHGKSTSNKKVSKS